MESNNATAEEALFYNIVSTRINKPVIYPNDPTTNPNLQVSGLNAGAGKVFGPAKVLGIMEGDRVDINTKYFYVGNQMAGSGPGNPPTEKKFPIEVFLDDSDFDIPPPPDVGSSAPSNVQLVNNLLTQLATIFTSSVSTISGGEFNQAGTSAAFGANSNLSTFLVSAFNNAVTNYPNNPRAFLIYLFFNKDFVFNPQVSGALQAITPDVLGNLAVTNVKFPENGYLYVYVCDESAMDVYFDNLQIIHYTNPLTEVNDYYPFGLLAKTATSLGGTPQKYKYNGKELQKDLAFNVLDYGARQ